uniref:DUF1015 domain-containing protein n=1 Tax=Magnetococcus massalia (strain MO-1) TaxID=451514 RepID=A0A1S7LEH9_MAGMO|nr:conserved protein of unknown function [Candidatus Magnetococcus massalia]
MAKPALVKPFAGWRPRADVVSQVAAPPYDVLNREEAAEMAAGNPHSFLHVSKAEIDLPADLDPYDPKVYATAKANYAKLKADGMIAQDEAPCFYVYRLIWQGRAQTGIVAAASVEAYDSDRIKKHEFTRPAKENDRTEFAWALKAHSGPVFLTYRKDQAIDTLVAEICKQDPVYDFDAGDGIQHTLWVCSDAGQNDKLEAAFDALPAVYVADGHHRSAAASRVHARTVEEGLGQADEEAPHNRFLSVLFPDDQMRILDYNRVVKDLGDLDEAAFMAEVKKRFDVTPTAEACSPKAHGSFGMYLGGKWYSMTLKADMAVADDPVKRLDVSLLSDFLLEPILGISDPRRDPRIDFVGGIRGMQGLEKRVDSGEMKVAFSLFATTMDDLMAVADSGQVMPPKSTWFEPKLRDGLVVQAF